MIHKYKKLNQTGFISGMFLVLYSLFRFLIEFTREPDIQVGYILNYMTMGMILSVPMFIFGIIFIYYSKKNVHQK
jgi:phosphatidylglycerol:prolipoprotein diacylglycerol transferase